MVLSTSLDGRGAIKVLADNWAQNPAVRARFLTEARILWRADHDRIVRVYEFGELADGRPWFAMALADRGSLRQRMAGRVEQGHRCFPAEVAVAYAGEIAECLTVVHELGYIHRDVNPGNVLIRTLSLHQQDARLLASRPTSRSCWLTWGWPRSRRWPQGSPAPWARLRTWPPSSCWPTTGSTPGSTCTP